MGDYAYAGQHGKAKYGFKFTRFALKEKILRGQERMS